MRANHLHCTAGQPASYFISNTKTRALFMYNIIPNSTYYLSVNKVMDKKPVFLSVEDFTLDSVLVEYFNLFESC